jgi:glycosyltransferase involved in cell wall biosynthesis
MTRLKVVSVVKRLHVGGDETRLVSLARHLDHERFEHLVVVAQGVTGRDEGQAEPMLRALREAVEVVVLDRDIVSVTATPAPVRAGPVRRVRDVGSAAAVLGALVGLFRERRPDVVDGRLNFGTVVGLAAARLARVPVVVSTGYFPEHWRRPPLLEPVGQLAMAGVDAFVTDAQATVEAFERWRWSSRARMVMIPNGVPPATTVRSRAEMRRHFGLPEDPQVPVVGSVCRMIEGKGYPTLVRAARTILRARPDAAFLFCGYAEDPAFRDRLLALAREAGIADRAVFTSYPGPVGDVLTALDVYVRASLEDSSPIGVHEAMSVGLPIVVTQVGGVTELVGHDEAALVVPPEDPDAVAAAVLRLLDDPGLAGRLGQEAVTRYQARHTPEQMARAHEELFTDLVEERRAASRRLPRLP